MTTQDALDRIDSYFWLSHFEEKPEVEFLDHTTVRLTGWVNAQKVGTVAAMSAAVDGFAEVVETYDLSCADVVECVSVEYLSGAAAGVAA